VYLLQHDDLWLTSESDDSVDEENTSSVAAENNESSQSSVLMPSADESGPYLRSSLRRRTQTPSAVVSRLRKRKADQSEDSPSTKQMKHDTTSSAEGLAKTTACSSGVRAAVSTLRSTTANATRSPHRALLRIDQPNGTVCFIALDNVSDLSQLPVTSLIQHLMANQKLTFSQAPANQRLAFSQASSSSHRMPMPQTAVHQRVAFPQTSSVLQTNVCASLVTSTAGQKPLVSSVHSSHSNVSASGNVAVHPVLPSSGSPSATSFIGNVSSANQRIASFIATSVSAGQSNPVSASPSSRTPLAASQILALPILSNQGPAMTVPGLRPPNQKPDTPAVNNGLAALFSAAMSVTTSHSPIDSRTLINCASNAQASEVNQALVLLNPGVNQVQTLVGPAVRCLGISANQNTPDVSIRANAVPMFMGLLANQQPTSAVQHRLLAVPLMNGSPASVAARLTAASVSTPRSVLTSSPQAAPLLSTCVSSLSTKLQPQPRYSGSMTVKALLGGRTAPSVDPLYNPTVKALLEGRIVSPVETILTKTNGTVTTTSISGVGLSESGSRTFVGGTLHPFSATSDQSAGVANRTMSLESAVASNATSNIVGQLSATHHGTSVSSPVGASVQINNPSHSIAAFQPSNLTVHSVKAAASLNSLQSDYQVPSLNNASASTVTSINALLQRTPSMITAGGMAAHRAPTVTSVGSSSALRAPVMTAVRSLPVQQLAQPGGDSVVPRLELVSVAGVSPLQSLKLIPGSAGTRLALQIVSVAGGTQQSSAVQLLPGSVMSQLVSAGLDINAIRAFVPQSRLRGPPPRAARNNTRTTTVMKAPIPALPRLNDLNHSPQFSSVPKQSVSSNLSNVRLPLVQSSVPSQSSTTVVHSAQEGNTTVSYPSAAASFCRVTTAPMTSPSTVTPARPPAAVAPGTLLAVSSPATFSTVSVSGTRPSQITPRKFQLVALPGIAQPVSSPGALQAVVMPGKMQTMVAPAAVQGTLQASLPTVPLKTFAIAGKIPAEATAGTVRALAMPGKVQSVASPGVIQAAQNVIMLQSSNGLVQFIQLPANCVRNPNVMNVAGRSSTIVPRPSHIVTSLSNSASSLLTQQKETAVNVTNSGVTTQSGAQSTTTQTSCLEDAANLFLMAANVVDQSLPSSSHSAVSAPGVTQESLVTSVIEEKPS
jgi:hypothetical protein